MSQIAAEIIINRIDPPTREAIELARSRQLEALRDLRRRLIAPSGTPAGGPIRPVQELLVS